LVWALIHIPNIALLCLNKQKTHTYTIDAIDKKFGQSDNRMWTKSYKYNTYNTKYCKYYTH